MERREARERRVPQLLQGSLAYRHGFDAAKVPLGDRLATLDAANVKLTDLINESRKYGETAEIAKLDARRDIIFRAVWKFVETLSELDGAGEFDYSARRVRARLHPLTNKRGF